MLRKNRSGSSLQNTAWADRAGVWASALCLVHCLLTPVLLSFSATLAQLLPSEAGVHRVLAVGIALIGAIAVIPGFRRHRRWVVVLLLACGLAAICYGAWFGDMLPQHWMEVAVTMLGSCLLVSAHRLNHRCCRQCLCTHGQRPSVAAVCCLPVELSVNVPAS
jgi:hypothetical protein